MPTFPVSRAITGCSLRARAGSQRSLILGWLLMSPIVIVLVVLLILMLAGGVPAASSRWGYGPSGLIGVVLIILLILLLLGRI